MSKQLGFVNYGLRIKWNVKDVMNYVIIKKIYDLGIHYTSALYSKKI